MAQNDIIDVSENASYSVAEAAVFLGKTDRQIRRYVNGGKLESAGAGRVTRASVEGLAGKNVPALSGASDLVSVPKSYLEELTYRAVKGQHAEAALLQLEHKGFEEKDALEREIERFTAELAEVRAELERERKRSFWGRIFRT